MQNGDLGAFRDLYDRYCDRAYRVARAVSVDEARAEDVVHEAFRVIWRARSTYRQDRPTAAAWLLTIVRDTATDVGRDGRHQATQVDDESSEHQPAPDGNVGWMARGASAIEVRRILAQLPQAQSEVLVLALYGELSQTEIAGELDLPVDTIRARMHRGLIAMRHEFQASPV